MEWLTLQCRGTHVGEAKISLYSSMTLSIYCCCAEEPCLEAATKTFFMPWGWIIRKTNLLVWEILLLQCFVVIKEMAVGRAISSILYNLLAKVIITERGLDPYTTCRFHKYACLKNTSKTSRGAMSHNTSSVKGLMLYGRRHYWLPRRSRTWWSNPMVYSCGCDMCYAPIPIGVIFHDWLVKSQICSSFPCCKGSIFWKDQKIKKWKEGIP